ncbi:MAG TPA: hypothetical protein VFA59_23225 [Vicinamibacterales bacterium]|nr:hypothetical protein [Vicinamibacterales bacterium]
MQHRESARLITVKALTPPKSAEHAREPAATITDIAATFMWLARNTPSLAPTIHPFARI